MMNDRFGGPRRSFSPVKIGDEFDVKIEAVGEKGDGIAKKNGFVIFIPNAKEGDEVKVKVTKVLRKFCFAEVVGKGTAPAEEDQEEPAAEEETAEEEKSEESEEPAEEGSSEDSEDFGEEEKKE